MVNSMDKLFLLIMQNPELFEGEDLRSIPVCFRDLLDLEQESVSMGKRPPKPQELGV